MSIRQRIHYWSLYWPFRLSFFVVLINTIGLSYVGTQLLSEEIVHQTAWQFLQSTLCLVALVFSGTLLGILVLYWLRLFFVRKRMQVNLIDETLNVSPMWQPWLGFVYAHLKINGRWEKQVWRLVPSEKHLLAIGSLHMQLVPEITYRFIRVEEIQGMVVHLQDPFRVFSLSIALPVNIKRVSLPDSLHETSLNIKPIQAKFDAFDTEHRVPFQGDLFHLQQYSPGDDIRRIVWKLFARHKTLLVRKPDLEYQHGMNTPCLILMHRTAGIGLNEHDDLIYATRYKQKLFTLLSASIALGVPIELHVPGKDTFIPNSIEQLAHWITTLEWEMNQKVVELDTMVDYVFVSSLCPSTIIDIVQTNLKNSGKLVCCNLFEHTSANHGIALLNQLVWLPEATSNKVSSMHFWKRYRLRKQTNAMRIATNNFKDKEVIYA